VRERDGSPEADGVGAVRRVGLGGPFVSREETVEFEPPHHLAYELRRGYPLRRYRADVDLDLDAAPGAAGGTTIRWCGIIEPLVPGTGALTRTVFTAMVSRFARGLAAAAAQRVGPPG
jgi:hypothetical protein